MDTKELLETLRESVRTTVNGFEEVAVAYSGGVDSSIIASLAKESARVTCYTCVMKGSFDARNVTAYADTEGLTLHVITLTRSDLEKLVPRAGQAIGSVNPIQVAYSIPVLSVIEHAQEDLVLVGSGADELFGGYAKYESSGDPRKQMERDLEKMLSEKDSLVAFGNTRGKTLGFPFVSPDVTELAISLPLERMLNASGRKVILREVARLLGLGSHDRPKKAAQYSSGVLKEMERMARSERMSTTDWLRSKTAEPYKRSA